MYAVIFKATLNTLDNDYSVVAKKLRQLALEHYGCLGFSSAMEGDQEIAVSYWENEQQILVWKQNAEHLLAQHSGRNKWYKSYEVDVTEIKRQYKSN